MADHISYMLNSMITAVDESLSYDGIVSIPDIGLEDVKFKSSLTGSLRDGMDRARMTGSVISRGAGRAASGILGRKRQHGNPSHPGSQDGLTREGNLSTQSLTPSDQLSEGLTDGEDEKLSTSSVGPSEMGERCHFVCDQGVAQQSYRDDETDKVPQRCFLRPSFGRTRSDPTSGEVASSREQMKLERDWEFIPVDVIVDTREFGSFRGKKGEERSRWPSRFGKGSLKPGRTKNVQLSDLSQETLSEKKEHEEGVWRASEETVVHISAADQGTVESEQTCQR